MSIKKEGIAVEIVVNILLVLIILLVLLPFLAIVSTSLEGTSELRSKGMTLWPTAPTFDTYKYLLTNKIGDKETSFLGAIGVSVIRTFGGATLSVLVQHMLAYALSFRKVRFNKFVTALLVVSMFLSGGLIPLYLVVSALGLTDTIMILVILGCVVPYNVFIMRNFMSGISYTLTEAAYVDGAQEVQIYFLIIVPLSLPIVATFWLFAAVSQWNDWFNAMIFVRSQEKYPLMLVLKNLLDNALTINDPVGTGLTKPMEIGLNSAAIVISTLPIVVLYIFLQKYFVSGAMAGSIKE